MNNSGDNEILSSDDDNGQDYESEEGKQEVEELNVEEESMHSSSYEDNSNDDSNSDHDSMGNNCENKGNTKKKQPKQSPFSKTKSPQVLFDWNGKSIKLPRIEIQDLCDQDDNIIAPCATLNNPGNACFLNCLVQVFADSSFRQMFLEINPLTTEERYWKSLVNNLLEVMIENRYTKLYAKQTMEKILSRKLLTSSTNDEEGYVLGRKQDPFEVFISFMNKLIKMEMQPDNSTNPFKQGTSFSLGFKFTCSNMECLHEWDQWMDNFSSLRLNITTEGTLDSYVEEYFLNGKLDVAPQKCCRKCKSDAVEDFPYVIYDFPDIMVIGLSKGTFDEERQEMVVNLVKVDFDLEWTPSTIKCLSHVTGKFKLFAIVNRIQDTLATEESSHAANTGHYTTYKDTQFGWVKMDDGDCTYIDKSELCTPSSYILFYKRIEEIHDKEHPYHLRGRGPSVPVKTQIKSEIFQTIAKAGRI